MSIPGAVYQWYLNDVLIPNATSNTYSSTVQGKFVVKITFDANQAKYATGRTQAINTTAIYSLNTSLLGIEDGNNLWEEIYFSAFPNPASQLVTLKTTELRQNKSAMFYNSLGIEVLRVTLDGIQVSVDVSCLPKGIYSIKLGNSVQKIVLE